MCKRLIFLGHVSVDTIQNINGINVQPGGAALHAAVAARTLMENVLLASVIGEDYKFKNELESFIHRRVVISKLPSTKFSIRYNDRWEAHYLEASYGAGKKISYLTLPKDALGPEDIIHISPLPPIKVNKIISKIKDASPKTKISVNTWIDYMKSRRDRKVLREISRKADFFILNESEAKILAESDSLSMALKIIESSMLVVTLGELGAIVNTGRGDVQMVPALRFPVEKLVDTTGAGDAWCGSFLAAYHLTSDITKAVTVASIISSIKCTGWGFSKLLHLRFKNVDGIIEYVIGLRDGKLQKTLSEYY